MIEATLGNGWNDIYNYDEYFYCEHEFICEWDEYEVVEKPNLEKAVFRFPVDEINVINEYGFSFNETLNGYYEHQGIDFATNVWANVYAAEDGVVESVYRDDALWGTEITISHNNNLKTVYRFVTDVRVSVGESVKRGDVIARVAEATGNEYKDGPHLHFEILENGTNVNPKKYLTWKEEEPEVPEEPENPEDFVIPTEKIVFNGHTYQYIPTYMTWEEAEAYCESLGGHLATVTSQAENNFIFQTFGKNGALWVWLGGFDKGNDNWAWVTGETWSDEFWAGSGEPNGGEFENHLHIYGNRWNDISGTDTNYILCEWDNLPVVERPSDVVIPEDSEDPEENNVYRIYSAEDLITLSKNDDYNGCVELMNSIDMQGMKYTPMKHFSGEFRGNGYTITNLYVTQGTLIDDYSVSVNQERYHDFYGVGLFAFSKYGIVRNLTLNMTAEIYSGAPIFFGGIFGCAAGVEIENCHVKMNLSMATYGEVSGIGGFIGCEYRGNKNVITNSSVDMRFEYAFGNGSGACGYLGGLTAHGKVNAENCEVFVQATCLAKGTLYAGGFAGRADNSSSSNTGAKITNCKASGFFEYAPITEGAATFYTDHAIGEGEITSSGNEANIPSEQKTLSEIDTSRIPEEWWTELKWSQRY